MIQRYAVLPHGHRECEWGQYVLYTDHLSALAARDEREREMRNALQQISDKGLTSGRRWIVDIARVALATDAAGAIKEEQDER